MQHITAVAVGRDHIPRTPARLVRLRQLKVDNHGLILRANKNVVSVGVSLDDLGLQMNRRERIYDGIPKVDNIRTLQDMEQSLVTTHLN